MATYEREGGEARVEGIDEVLAPYREAVEEALKRLEQPDNPPASIVYKYIERGGKRIRPTIVLLVCEGVKGSFRDAVPIAVAYELAHAASLMQDDVIDNSSTRHNLPTAHTRHGVATAILLSDVLIFKVFDQLAAYDKVKISKNRLAALARYVGQAASEAARGEFLDLELSKRNPSVQNYVTLAGLKTGSLFASAAASGAVVGGANAVVVRDMHEFGWNLGIAYQVMDDILDVTGKSEVMGKPILKDLQNNATNIVIMHAMMNADPPTRNRLTSMTLRSAYGLTEVMELLDILDELGSVEFARKLCEKHTAIARGKLAPLHEGRARDALGQITRWLEAQAREEE